MIELRPPVKRPWQFKALLSETACNCWDCLRKRGITPDPNAHETHRRNILPGSPIYDVSNGRRHDSSAA